METKSIIDDVEALKLLARGKRHDKEALNWLKVAYKYFLHKGNVSTQTSPSQTAKEVSTQTPTREAIEVTTQTAGVEGNVDTDLPRAKIYHGIVLAYTGNKIERVSDASTGAAPHATTNATIDIEISSKTTYLRGYTSRGAGQTTQKSQRIPVASAGTYRTQKYPPIIADRFPNWPMHLRNIKEQLGRTPAARPRKQGSFSTPKQAGVPSGTDLPQEVGPGAGRRMALLLAPGRTVGEGRLERTPN